MWLFYYGGILRTVTVSAFRLRSQLGSTLGDLLSKEPEFV